jgi:hypothetical protein
VPLWAVVYSGGGWGVILGCLAPWLLQVGMRDGRSARALGLVSWLVGYLAVS